MSIPEKFQKDIQKAIEILKKEGATEIYIFGSLAEESQVRPDSDIDVAVRGLSADRFFAVYGRLLTTLEHNVDLVDLDSPAPFSQLLLEKGIMQRVA